MSESLLAGDSAQLVGQQAGEGTPQIIRAFSSQNSVDIVCIFVIEPMRRLNALRDLMELCHKQCGASGDIGAHCATIAVIDGRDLEFTEIDERRF